VIWDLTWRCAVVLAAEIAWYVAGVMDGSQFWLTVPAGFALGWVVANAYFAEPKR
jgi:hypothetical protein